MKSAFVSILMTMTGYFLFQILSGIIDLIKESIRYDTLIAIAPDPSPTRIQYEIAESDSI